MCDLELAELRSDSHNANPLRPVSRSAHVDKPAALICLSDCADRGPLSPRMGGSSKRSPLLSSITSPSSRISYRLQYKQSTLYRRGFCLQHLALLLFLQLVPQRSRTSQAGLGVRRPRSGSRLASMMSVSEVSAHFASMSADIHAQWEVQTVRHLGQASKRLRHQTRAHDRHLRPALVRKPKCSQSSITYSAHRVIESRRSRSSTTRLAYLRNVTSSRTPLKREARDSISSISTWTTPHKHHRTSFHKQDERRCCSLPRELLLVWAKGRCTASIRC